MNRYVITSDTTCDLPEDFVKAHELSLMPLYYNIDDVIYGDTVVMEPKEFYDSMRNGKMPTTMAVNPEYAANCFRSYLEAGMDILHIAFSSGLSSSYNAACLAANDLKEEFPERTIVVIDSKAASMGEGLLVYYGIQNQKHGMSLAENAAWIQAQIEHLGSFFTVNDLNHLHRGGRVSKTTAVIGSLINVKPILRIDKAGKLVPHNNVRGRKRALSGLVDHMEQCCKYYKNEIVMISHGDCLEDAEYVAKLIQERLGIHQFMFNNVCPTIGAHTGPGVVALFFLGDISEV